MLAEAAGVTLHQRSSTSYRQLKRPFICAGQTYLKGSPRKNGHDVHFDRSTSAKTLVRKFVQSAKQFRTSGGLAVYLNNVEEANLCEDPNTVQILLKSSLEGPVSVDERSTETS